MRASLVYALVILGFFALVIFSNRSSTTPQRAHRRLIARTFNSSRHPKAAADYRHHENAAFDPLVAEIERKKEDREWEREYFSEQYKNWNVMHNNNNEKQEHHDDQQHAPGEEEQPFLLDDEHYDDPEDYLNDGEHFNISQRLEFLFPQLDVNPKDGFVSLSELQDWHVQQSLKLSQQRADREFNARDRNHDGLISLYEYLPHLSAEDFANSSKLENGQAAWWKSHFDIADDDGNGGLNRTEFADFLHPEDSHNPRLHAWLRREQIKENDANKDGKLSLDEFDNIFDMLRYYGADLSHLHKGNDAEGRKHMFENLDRNKDGFLTEDELEPIMNKLHPGESFYAKQQAESLIHQADGDSDGRLTLKEMLDHPYVFYSTAYSDGDNDLYDIHDEFR